MRSARTARRRWSVEEKAQIVRESFWSGHRVGEVAQRYGLSRKQLSAWRSLVREGKFGGPSLASPAPEPVAVTCEAEGEPAFVTLEVDPAVERGRG